MIKGVPRGVYRGVLGAFLAQLRGHPHFANNRVVKTWVAWDGKETPEDLTVDMMPAAQVRLLSGPVARFAGARRVGGPMMNINQSHPQVLIDLFTPGTDQGDLADLAELLTQALAPQDPAERSALAARFRDAGIKDWQLVREILPNSAESFSPQAIAGQGAYELTIFTAS